MYRIFAIILYIHTYIAYAQQKAEDSQNAFSVDVYYMVSYDGESCAAQ